jgi:hypothetical protein
VGKPPLLGPERGLKLLLKVFGISSPAQSRGPVDDSQNWFLVWKFAKLSKIQSDHQQERARIVSPLRKKKFYMGVFGWVVSSPAVLLDP